MKRLIQKFFILFFLIYSNLAYSNSCETVSVDGTNYTVSQSGSHTNINSDPYGLGCVDEELLLDILGGVMALGLVVWLISPAEDIQEEETAFSAYSSKNEFGIQFNKLPDNYFLKLTSPKGVVSKLEKDIHYSMLNEDQFNKPVIMKLDFGFELN